MPRVVVTGMSVNTALGDTLEGFLSALMAGRSAISRWQAFPADRIYSKIGGDLSAYDVAGKLAALEAIVPSDVHRRLRKLVSRVPWTTRLSMLLAVDGWCDAGLFDVDGDPSRRAVIVSGHNLNALYQYDSRIRFEEDAQCRAYQLDVRESAAVERVGEQVLDDFDTVHVVVANAAITHAGLAFSTADEAWRDVLDTNLTGAFYVARQFLPAFLANGFGRFVFMSSIAAQGMSGDAAYSASKAGLMGLSGALAKEYGRKGITSNALLLSLFETEMTLKELSPQNRQFYAEHCPVGRIGQVAEVAAAVLFLASAEASFVNGQAIGVTGGLDWLH